jgi:hypothetical protein
VGAVLRDMIENFVAASAIYIPNIASASMAGNYNNK